MALNLAPFRSAGNKAATGVVSGVTKATGRKPAVTTGAAKYAPNDAFPSSLLVPTLPSSALRDQAHAAAQSDVNAALAALPADATVTAQYGRLGQNIVGINQALVDALGGTQHYQIGTANGIAQGYTNAAGADQQAANQAALALGGAAAPLVGSGGAAAASLSAPGVSAANATGGLIDAAKLRGANQQITNQQDLSTALAALAAQRSATQAKEGSYYNDYLTAAQKANQDALIANQGAAFKYAQLGIDQQKANALAGYYGGMLSIGGDKANTAAAGVADTAAYHTGMLGVAGRRADIAKQNADTAAYRAQHPPAGTQRDPNTGLTQGQTTTALNRLEQGWTRGAQGGLKGKTSRSRVADKYSLAYETVPAPGVAPGLGHVALTPEQYQQYMAAPRSQRALIAGLPQGTYVPGTFQTPQPSHYATTTATTGRSYYGTEHALEAQIAQAAQRYHLGWTPAQVTREAQQAMVRAGWKPGMYGMPGAPAPVAPPADRHHPGGY